MTRAQLHEKLERAWRDLGESYAGLSEEDLLQSGVTGSWSVRDIIAHVTWWEEEALKHLPLILEGGRPPRYADAHGGIDAFNAKMTEKKKSLSLSQVLEERDRTHRRLVELVNDVSEDHIVRESRFRRRLRLDTYGHYRIHARAIRAWRQRRGGS